MREEAFEFDCAGDSLVGIVSLPDVAVSSLGVLVVVGGPQYRVGSHRQFLLLARSLASHGTPVMRFDYRGMGDATGDQRSFERVDEDIRAAIDTFMARCPGLQGVVLWGLCDGASAAALFAPTDARVAGLVLLNPWVRTEVGEAKTYLKHYYLRRLLSPAFWKKFLGGGIQIRRSLSELSGTIKRARAGGTPGIGARDSSKRVEGRSPAVLPDDSGLPLPERMAQRVKLAGLPLLVILSGKDFVAAEFEACATASAQWGGLMAQTERIKIGDANHTFSSSAWRDAVAEASGAWIARLAARKQEVS